MNSTFFLGHGSPISILKKDYDFRNSINKHKLEIDKSKGIIFISAHWINDETLITGSSNPTQIYDFFGSPQELYKIKSKYTGDENKSIEIAKTLNIGMDYKRGFDHGVWGILVQSNFDIDIPVFQISINKNMSYQEHFKLGKKLLDLRKKGYVIIGSGNISHNLSLMVNNFNEGLIWNKEFNINFKNLLEKKDYKKLIEEKFVLQNSIVIPEDSHYLPLLYILGSLDKNESTQIIYEGYQLGSISMLSFKNK